MARAAIAVVEALASAPINQSFPRIEFFSSVKRKRPANVRAACIASAEYD